MTISNKTRKWLRAGLETLIHGGTAAAISSLTACFVDSKDWGFGSANFFKMFGAAFLSNGGIRFLQWWNNNPLPPEDSAPDAKTLAPIPVISLNPLSKVQPVVPNEIPKP